MRKSLKNSIVYTINSNKIRIKKYSNLRENYYFCNIETNIN